MYGRAEWARRERRDDLVRVHVARRAGAGLEHVDRELRVLLAPRNAARGLGDRAGNVTVENAKRAVDGCRGGLDRAERSDQRTVDRLPGQREVVDRALGLRLP